MEPTVGEVNRALDVRSLAADSRRLTLLRSAAVGSRSYSLMVAFFCVAGVRLFLTLYLAAAALLFPQPDLRQQYAYAGVPLLGSGWEGLLLGVWQREDALWYEKIATVGYSSSDMTPDFFPLFPLLMKGLSAVTGIHPVAAGMAISDLSLLVALFLLHRLLVPQFGSGVANRSLIYLSLFPSAFFLHAPFTESLTLALVLLGFFLISRGYWAVALVPAYLAGLTRPQGVLLGLALAVQYLEAEKGGLWLALRDWRRMWHALVLVVAPLLGFATFRAFVDTPWARPGIAGGAGPMAYQSLAIPGTPLLYAARRILSGEAYPIDLYDFVVAVLFIVLALATLRRLNVGYSVYAGLFLAAPLSRFSPVFALMSFSRYALLLFPCFVVLAMWGRHKWVHLAVIFLWMWWLAVWSFKFYTGYFVG